MKAELSDNKQDPSHLSGQDTRVRLLEAAGEVFAERGFHGVQIRDICARAGANIAAVNYHFKGKEGLYREVLKYAHHCAMAVEELQVAIPADASAEQKLGVFVHTFFRSMLSGGRPSWNGKLLAREMIEPSAALDDLVMSEITPKFAMLRSITAELLEVAIEHPAVRWFGASVISQCLFWEHNKPVIQRLYPDLSYSDDQIRFIAEHVVRTCIFAMHGARGKLDDYAAWPEDKR